MMLYDIFNLMNDLPVKPFATALSHLLRTKHLKTMTQAKLAQKVGVSQQYISYLKTGEREGKEEIRRKIAQLYGFSYDDFISLGKGLIIKQNRESPDRETVDSEYDLRWSKQGSVEDIRRHITHEEIIRRFRDPETAKRLNKMLVDIEHEDPDAYKLAITYIQGIHDALKIKKTPKNSV